MYDCCIGETYQSGDIIEGNVENVEVLKIYFPEKVTSEFKRMRSKFRETFFNVGSIMMKNPQSISLDNMKYDLGAYNKTSLWPQLAQCQNIRDILKLVRDNSSLDDISVLEFVVNEFNIKEANPVIKEYKEAVEEFKGTKLSQCLKDKFSKASLLLCERIIIVIDEDADGFVFKDVERLSSAVLPQHIRVNVIRGDDAGGTWKFLKQKSLTDSFDETTLQTMSLTTSQLPGTEESSFLEETKKNEDQVILLQEKVESTQRQLDEEKKYSENKKQFHEQVTQEYEEKIIELNQQYEKLKTDNELAHKQLEELKKELKKEKQASSSFKKQKEVDLREKEESKMKIDNLRQELELQRVKDYKEVSVQCDYTITQSEQLLIRENERLESLLKDQNVQVQQKEEYEILQETETVHTCTYISKDNISKLSVILEPFKDDWYHIGQCLEVKESVLTEIKKMIPVDSRLTHVLETWCHEKDRTITELKNSLKRMDRDDILEDLHELPTGQYTMNNDEEYDINVKDSNDEVKCSQIHRTPNFLPLHPP
ncbi:PREDICTED: synaptonemal complex protein 1-like [Amphimedon queenslandica]|uniref:Death domain-containing protein n=1 Tax=Amphimedon queenslandica TaxID=400682 RepID=A0AAN0JCU4_AMPQE|nr:PREDICTED: synaptonemal complex protein 1-like [Amphimedon queenslandica]|eukprot:XP_019854804.1 PREDICTED: synaptonemal complex protein 1-like [Amphimedon queenslandica]